MTTDKPRVGDVRWEVEWCTKVVVTVEGVQPELCDYGTRYFDTYADALAFAVETWPATTDTLGIVEITPQEYVRYNEDGYRWGEWEPCGDTLVVSDASGQPEPN